MISKRIGDLQIRVRDIEGNEGWIDGTEFVETFLDTLKGLLDSKDK